jgi:hypothetical protein
MGPKAKNCSLFVALVVLLGLLPIPGWAAPPVSIEVKTVLAASGESYLDPQLSEMAGELQGLFRYTSYRLLGKDRLTLQPRQTGSVALPGNRRLQITYQGVDNQRVELLLKMFKNSSSVFETNIRLNNRSSIIVGGPRYEKGYLLFNLYSAF